MGVRHCKYVSGRIYKFTGKKYAKLPVIYTTGAGMYTVARPDRHCDAKRLCKGHARRTFTLERAGSALALWS